MRSEEKSERVCARVLEYCESNAIHLKQKRELLLRGLAMAGKPLSAYELTDYCFGSYGQRVPVMTVYRVLSFLEQKRLVHKLGLVNKYVVCDCLSGCGHHEMSYFLICPSCQKVAELNISSEIAHQFKSSIHHAGFVPGQPQLEVMCVCMDCKSHSPSVPN
jgi:Fur family transcriptional regulator, zinc uptake regulator